MDRDSKSQQLQIRVSPAEKRAIKRAAEGAGVSMSAWILGRVLPSEAARFQGFVEQLARSEEPGFIFAELLEAIDALDASSFEQAVAEPPAAALDHYWQNYLAATVEHAAARKHARVPAWTQGIAPLEAPAFGSSLASLQLHLLVHSPPAFIQRNLFIDANVGDRV